jgi:DEAD/DEAH box helicase domain-containing protein
VESTTGGVLGTVDAARAPAVVHTGAVYVHQGRSYVVTLLDLDDASALVVAGDPGWSTQARSTSDFTIIGAEHDDAWGPGRLAFGEVEVTEQVTSFLRRLPGGEVIGEHPLDLPARTLHTRAVWWTLPQDQLVLAGVAASDIPGALHAAEHA